MCENPIKYGAISIDNCIFKSSRYRFNNGVLGQLSQFKNNDIKLLQTDIVHNEAIKHISENLNKSYSSINTALREIKLNSCLTNEGENKINKILSNETPAHEKAIEIINLFYDKTGAILIKANDLVKVEDVMNLYFSNKPPFEKKADKKNEFPDVFALLTLEGWAKENDTHVLAVSNDNGWINYSKTSTWITVVRNLSDALSLIQKKDMTDIIRLLLIKDVVDLIFIEEEVQSSVNYSSFYIDAESPFFYDYNDLSVNFYDVDFHEDDESLVEFEIVRAEEKSVTIKISCEITIDAEAVFDFYVTDTIDHDDVLIGSSLENVQQSYDADVFITITGNFQEDDFEKIIAKVSEVEVVSKLTNIDFGFVEPDYSGDEEDY